MKWLRKVDVTPLSTIAKVINSLATASTKNAPSINAVNEGLAQVWRNLYPVGSIYMSVNSTNPAELFGGTWEKIQDTFLMAAGSTYANGQTGGSATNTLSVGQLPSHKHAYDRATDVQPHRLTINEIPSHTHDYYITNGLQTYVANGGGTQVIQSLGQAVTPNQTGSVGGDGWHDHTLTVATSNTQATGAGESINNLPPYLAVNVWKRTA